ncbi:uncharacterized protein [Watersipora subatra]|uniref:uncharacterized protein n=1 Tax=Watersipora subatra TaxID=2589382 RepID=UPI00355C35D7
MMSKIALLLLGGAVFSCYGQCGHDHPYRRNLHGLRWSVEAPWRSAFPTVFDDDWFFVRPYYHILGSYHDDITTHHLTDTTAETSSRVAQKCSSEKPTTSESREEEMKSQQEFAKPNREEVNPSKENKRERRYNQDREENQRREHILMNPNGKDAAATSADRKFSHDMETLVPEHHHKPCASQQQQFSTRIQDNCNNMENKQQFRQTQQMGETSRRQAVPESQKKKLPNPEIIRRSRPVEIARHKVEGYVPDDITVNIAGGRVTVQGKHICHCSENCISKEFTRSYVLPADVSPRSITATLDKHGILVVQGQHTNQRDEQLAPLVNVHVQGIGISQSTEISPEELRRCLRTKGGIKLSKMNQRTGQVQDENYVYDQDVTRQSLHDEDPAYVEDAYVETED